MIILSALLMGALCLRAHDYSDVEKLIQEGQYHHAQVALEAITAILPEPTVSDYFRIGNLFCSCGDLSKALMMFKKTSQLIPHNMSPVYNIAYLLKLMGRTDESISLYETILTVDPNHDSTHLGLAFAYLQKGKFAKGWAAHEYNLKRQGKFAPELRALIKDNNLQDKRILLTPEGGLGDSIQFVRYAKRFHDAGAYVMVVSQKALIPLFSLSPYIDQIIEPGQAVPPFDAHATLMSVPAALHDDPALFASTMPYLAADAHLVEKWQLTVGPDRNLKVGLCWQSDVFNDSSRLPIARRGIPLQLFEPLSTYETISWYSLQKHDGAEQAHALDGRFKLITYDDLDTEHGAFMDTAALIESLDVVITIDSAVAHLAGALGKEVWLLLPYATDWRWIEGQTISPWYPTMTIFKQENPFDWSAVIAAIDDKLAEKSKAHTQNITSVSAEISIGELIDKITILTIKNNKIVDPKKLKNIRTELATLRVIQKNHSEPSSYLEVLEHNLFETNSKLWTIEDQIRDKEREQLFDDEFITLARNVYFTNDHRMSIKNEINSYCGSRINEEKSYRDYTQKIT
jgi:tetratricopeptide (TPR) repeat protein